MKYKIVLATLLFIGCKSKTSETINTNEYAAIDSIIGKSQQNLTVVGGANQKTDSLITKKIDKTAKKIEKLETEIKVLKAENNELKEKLNDIDDDNGKPYRIRTISDY